MVGQVVTGAVNTGVSAVKEEEGLVNQLFKIALLAGILLVLAGVAFVLIWLFSFDIGGLFEDTFSFITAPFRLVGNVFDASVSVFTGGASAIFQPTRPKKRIYSSVPSYSQSFIRWVRS